MYVPGQTAASMLGFEASEFEQEPLRVDPQFHNILALQKLNPADFQSHM